MKNRKNEDYWQKIVLKSFRTQKNIHFYRIQNKKVQDDDTIFIVKAIDQHQDSLQVKKPMKIQLLLNNIGPIGCRALSRGQWCNLQHLDLSHNNMISDQGCKYLIQGQWPQLRFVLMANCSIGQKGCHYLSKGRWTHLQHLILYFNRIGNRGCIRLAKTNFPNLQFLDLNNNGTDDFGCLVLSKMHFPLLRQLGMLYDNISRNGSKYLKDKAIQKVYFNCDFMPSS